MGKFKVTLDRKFIMWHRISAEVEADSLEEAQDKLLKFDEGEQKDLNPEDVSKEWLYDSCESISRKENLYMLEGEQLTSGMIFEEEDLNKYPIVEFEESENYEI